MNTQLLSLFNATAAPLRFPREVEKKVHRYVRQHQGGSQIGEAAPFRRQLDLWAAAVAVACATGKTPRQGPSSSWGKKFVDTRAVQLDAELADLLVILAAAEFGLRDARLSDAAEIMELANCYAAAGVEEVLAWLDDPSLRHTNLEKTLRGLKRTWTEASARGAGASDPPAEQG